MIRFLEEPIYSLLIGVPLIIILGILWIRSGQRPWLMAMAAAVLVTGGLLVAERLVETDSEMLSKLLEQIARDVESNDLERILQHIHPSARQTVQRVRAEFPRYEIHAVKITKFWDLSVDRQRQPPQAHAELNVSVLVSFGQFRRQRVVRHVTVDFERDGDRWLVRDYSHQDPLRGFREERAKP